MSESLVDDPAARPRVKLLAGRHKRVKAGHPWAYSNEIVMDRAAKALAPGRTVELVSDAGEALGVGFFNPHTLVALRLLALLVIDTVTLVLAPGARDPLVLDRLTQLWLLEMV